jgi:membrane protease YdiL (CAAX protease family)
MLPQRLRPFVAFCIGLVLFAALSGATSWIVHTAALQGMAARQIIVKPAMLVLSVALMAIIARPRNIWGLAAPRSWMKGTLAPVAIGGLLGAAATATILGFEFPPMAGMREMGLLRMVALVWFGSTIAEEVFVRGLIQGWMQPPDVAPHSSPPADVADHATSKPVGSGSGGGSSGGGGRVIASGLLFGAMHASLFLNNDARTAATIVIATTLLGLVCAWSREQTGSLVGPLLAHFAFNACSIIGGIAVIILKGFPPNIGPP